MRSQRMRISMSVYRDPAAQQDPVVLSGGGELLSMERPEACDEAAR